MATADRAQECAVTSTSDVNVFLLAETFSELIGLFVWSRPLMPYSHPVWHCPPEHLLRTGTHCTQDFKGWGQRIYKKKKTQDFSRLQSVDGLLDPAALVCSACAIASNWSLAIKKKITDSLFQRAVNHGVHLSDSRILAHNNDSLIWKLVQCCAYQRPSPWTVVNQRFVGELFLV